MSDIERLTVTLPAEMAAAIRGAVADGDYASTSEVVRDALRGWKSRRAVQLEELERLRRDIDKGLADLEAGRVREFDVAAIVEQGRKLSASRSV